MNMNGMHILVTGAASGMGAATASLLLERGAQVTAVDLDEAGLGRLGGDVRAIRLDLTDPDAIAQQLGGLELDGVANIAGLGPDHDSVRRGFQVNLQAPLRVIEAVREGLRPGAAIVNVASIVGRFSDDRFDELIDDPLSDELLDRAEAAVADGALAYTYSKRGVIRQSLRLAVELAPDVRVNMVSPGLIDTPMGARSLELPWTQKLEQRIPLGRKGDPGEVARTIAFLLSEESSYLSGNDIAIDGGYGAYQTRRLAARSAA